MEANNNFFASTKSLLILCEILGIIPYNYTNKKILLRKYFKIYIMFLISVMTILYTQCALEVISFAKGHNMLSVLLSDVHYIVTCLGAIYNRKRFLHSAFSARATEMALYSAMNLKFDHKSIRKHITKIYIGRATLIVLNVAVQVYAFSFSFWLSLAFQLTILHSTAIHCYTVAHALMVKQGFEMINALLQQEADDYFELVCKTRALYHNLTKTVASFNKALGLTLLSAVTHSFVKIVVGIHFSYTTGSGLTVFNYLGYVVDLIYTSHVCDDAIGEGKKAKTLIYRIPVTEPAVQNEIQMFSLQIANELEHFTAADVFPINHSLIFSVIGGVSTLLTILVQLA